MVTILIGTILASGCATTPPRSLPIATARVGPVPQAAATPAPESPLPPLTVQSVGGGVSARRIASLDMVGQDLPTVLRELAATFGLGHQIDPSVQGQVTMSLSDVTLEGALNALVLPYGYQYQVQANVLRVIPARLETRIYELDYVSVARVGTSSTVIQRTLGSGRSSGAAATNTGVGASGFGGVGGGSITSTTVADFWDGLRLALEGIVFAGAAGGDSVVASSTSTTGSAASTVAGSSVRGPAAASRSAGGRRLTIDPLPGLVSVTAAPEILAEVEAYIIAIERSVQRQVLLEAKIVEVRLNDNFEFGIDWSLVRRIGGVNLAFNAGATGTQFTLDDDDGDVDDSINIVLRALESQGDVNVLQTPQLSVLNNQPASFAVTTDDVFFEITRTPVIGPTGGTIGFTQEIVPVQVSAGITLDVVAQIGADNVISMNVRPSITDIIAERTVELQDGTQASAPVIDRRETDTMVRVRDGETAVIGGLMTTREGRDRTGIPGLRDLPLIGPIFGSTSQSTEKRELVIFITPRIVAGTVQPGG